ncbi:MAG: UDP-N-acetylmuramoyl-L-alanyl-D-glutamate--2,6-diaminopimelate ligase [Acidimicrobiia bacterium]|nr:UDP-N-acetylmuramoyl-L-alanyl-D-glutamate--2,6-diaminopimelate ligase [Acidimicrobiia bacterium]
MNRRPKRASARRPLPLFLAKSWSRRSTEWESPPMAENLAHLAELVGGIVEGEETVTVSDATHDSRQAGPGTLFIAVTGFTSDGHNFVDAAADSGSPALMVEHAVSVDRPQIIVENSRRAMPTVAAEIHGNPSRRLQVIGVTGTNGKTTVTHMLEAIVEHSGRRSGLIGTINTRIDGDEIPNVRTTPEATDLQRLLALMVERDVDIVAAEVSSHALDLGRVDATRFAVAAFTNLSQDHLDFHGTIDEYFECKKLLFDPKRSEQAVIWIDDPRGRELLETTNVAATTVSIADTTADVWGHVVDRSMERTAFDIHIGGETARVNLPLGGDFNVENALVAAAAVHVLGLGTAEIVDGLEALPQIPGRFEAISDDVPFSVIVDYAHSPNGIAAAISFARAVTTGRVLALIGAGGDRDRLKRPAMGAATSEADLVYVTSDNPRTEDPEAIIDAVASGIPPEVTFYRITDRRAAINEIISSAREGDTVLILGRGHERGQEIAGAVAPFDDRLVAREAVASRPGAR